ncbi:Ribose-5-phosphate isomerase [Smittium mucronatum]|uniref:Ribose-5-phosphate isomerase n=1 Tax=Smittium mucronatum TaxID=133383 RepID=A0A1R0GS05_9FUNG|nr:Ribose-5-phosphate isomerase [Smittium mucronatum]OLY79673.1 Ribose-5-phosphate isomerase [Smittium mucronatum]
MSSKAQIIEHSKREAARAAVDKNVNLDVKVFGVGSGSTIVYAFERLVEMHQQGLVRKDLICIPTSYQARTLIQKSGIRCADLDEFPNVDVTIDGGDEVDHNLNAIKGGGAAHMREKAVAKASAKMVIVAGKIIPFVSFLFHEINMYRLCFTDFRKNSEFLGTQWTNGVPVEVIPFASEVVLQAILKLSPKSNPFSKFGVQTDGKDMFEFDVPKVEMRAAVKKAGPVVTDNGNLILDANFGKIYNPQLLELCLKQITGVVEVGLFSGVAKEAWFGNEDGTVSVKHV